MPYLGLRVALSVFSSMRTSALPAKAGRARRRGTRRVRREKTFKAKAYTLAAGHTKAHEQRVYAKLHYFLVYRFGTGIMRLCDWSKLNTPGWLKIFLMTQ